MYFNWKTLTCHALYYWILSVATYSFSYPALSFCGSFCSHCCIFIIWIKKVYTLHTKRVRPYLKVYICSIKTNETLSLFVVCKGSVWRIDLPDRTADRKFLKLLSSSSKRKDEADGHWNSFNFDLNLIMWMNSVEYLHCVTTDDFNNCQVAS